MCLLEYNIIYSHKNHNKYIIILTFVSKYKLIDYIIEYILDISKF